MDSKRLSLTGPWMGRYNYVSMVQPPVAFNATFDDDDGNISGEIIEPNTFTELTLDSLLAGVIGVREETLIRFTKAYTDFNAPKIDYEGRINSKFTRIDGTWSFPHAPWQHGTFVMIRDAVAVDASARRTRIASETLKRS